MNVCPPKGFRGLSGFTLLEVMLVTMILLMVATMSLPFISTQTEATRLRETSLDLEGLVRMARMVALRNAAPVELRITPQGAAFEILNAENVLRETVDLPKGVTLEAETATWEKTKSAGQEVRVRFSSAGFAEIPPIIVRSGEYYIAKRFHPLTGLVEDEAFSLP